MKKCRYRRKPFKPVSYAKLRETRILSRLSVDEVAQMLRVTCRTVRNWESGRVQVPYAAFKLLRILTGYELPSDAWRGWMFLGEVFIVTRGEKLHSARFRLFIVDFRNGQTMAHRSGRKT
nr:VC1465 family Xer recombination activation factor [Nitrosomonas ureae]